MASVRQKVYGSYEVLYRDPAGRQRSRSFKRKTDANRFAKAVDTDKTRGDYVDPRLARATIGQYADKWWDTLDVKPKTRQVYEGHLRIKANPAWRLKLSKGRAAEMHFLTPEQVDALARAIQEPLGQPRFNRYDTAPDYELLIYFAAYTGLRAREIEALRVKHLDLRTGRITVADSLAELHSGSLHFGRSTKTGKIGVVRMPKFLSRRMVTHVAGRPPDALFFSAAEGGPMRHSNFYFRHFLPALQRAGLRDSVRFTSPANAR
jgi:integrase